jgi:hypothetical protein
MSRSNTLHDP